MSKSKLQEYRDVKPIKEFLRKIEVTNGASIVIPENKSPVGKIIVSGKAVVVNKYKGEEPCLVKIGENSSLRIEGICFEISTVILSPGAEFHFPKHEKNYSIFRNQELSNELVITDIDCFIKEFFAELSGDVSYCYI